MKWKIESWLRVTLHYFYPNYCLACGHDPINSRLNLCSRCLRALPETEFFTLENNAVEKVFLGRLPIEAGAALYYFSKDSLMQELLIQLKYRNNASVGQLLGRMMGRALRNSERFSGVDLLVPVPLNAQKEFRRGYNQAYLICEGIASVWPKPIAQHAMERTRFTHSQTQQNRLARWQNMEQVFQIKEPAVLSGKHILLVDDVITTGATIEFCGSCLLRLPGIRLSICSAAYTFR
jgi:ComF family protein